MAIPYRTAIFKSANVLAIAILGSTAKFNSHQYFQLYGINLLAPAIVLVAWGGDPPTPHASYGPVLTDQV